MEIKNLSQLKLGSTELSRWQELLNKRALNPSDAFVIQYGLEVYRTKKIEILNKNTTFGERESGKWKYSSDWKVTKDNDTQVLIQPGTAVLKDRYPRAVKLPIPTVLDIPQSDGVYKLLISYLSKETEEGTVSVENGSNVVNGTDTKFTEIFSVNRRLIVDGNIVSVLSVDSDTQLTLAENYDGDTITDEEFSVGGWFVPFPNGVNDNVIYEYDSYQFVWRTDAKLDTEYWLAEVTISGGVIVEVVDKRKENILKLFQSDEILFEIISGGGDPPDPEGEVDYSIINYRIFNVPIRDEYDFEEPIFKFGYDRFSGTGSNSTITIVNPTSQPEHEQMPDFTEDQLKGWGIYVGEQNYVIVGNTATSNNHTTLDVVDPYGNTVNLTGLTISTVNPAILHPNCYNYELRAIPYVNGSLDYGKQRTKLIGVHYGEPVITGEIPLKANYDWWCEIVPILDGVPQDAQPMIGTDEPVYWDFLGKATYYENPYAVNIGITPIPVGLTAKAVNFRVHDIVSEGTIPITPNDNELLSNALQQFNKYAKVIFKWCYDHLTGTGDPEDSVFWITNNAYSADNYFPDDTFNDFRIYIPGIGDCRIVDTFATSSGKTKLLIEKNGQAVDTSGITINSSDPARTHFDAERYHLVAVPTSPLVHYDGNWDYNESIDYINLKGFVETAGRLILPPNYKFRVYLTPKFVGISLDDSSKLELLHGVEGENVGSYNSSITTETETYDYPLLVEFPFIDDPGELQLISTGNGFTAKLTGWEKAEKLDWCYMEGELADFNNPGHKRLITTTRTMTQPGLEGILINVAVRGLIGNQIVTDVLTGQIVAGSGGVDPDPKILWHGFIKMYCGRVTVVSRATQGAKYIMTCSAGVYGNDYTLSWFHDQSFVEGLIGKLYIDDNDAAFRVISIYSDDAWNTCKVVLERVYGDSQSVPDDTNGNYAYIGYALAGSAHAYDARIASVIRGLPSNWQITKIVVDIISMDYVDNGGGDIKPGVAGIKQKGSALGSDTIVLPTKGEKPQDVDVKIKPELDIVTSKRDVEIHFYHPSDADKNRASIYAEVTIHGTALRG